MKVQIRKWGNSASIRIPASLMDAAHFEIDQEVELHEDDGRLIVEPVTSKRYSIDELVAGIDENNMHELIDDGVPAGREVW